MQGGQQHFWAYIKELKGLFSASFFLVVLPLHVCYFLGKGKRHCINRSFRLCLCCSCLALFRLYLHLLRRFVFFFYFERVDVCVPACLCRFFACMGWPACIGGVPLKFDLQKVEHTKPLPCLCLNGYCPFLMGILHFLIPLFAFSLALFFGKPFPFLYAT